MSSCADGCMQLGQFTVSSVKAPALINCGEVSAPTDALHLQDSSRSRNLCVDRGQDSLSTESLEPVLCLTAGVLGQASACNLPVKCPECGLVLSQSRNLKRHFQVCHQATVYPCDLCNSSYNRFDNLQKHIRDKHGIPTKLACPSCKRSFRSRTVLEKHMAECCEVELLVE